MFPNALFITASCLLSCLGTRIPIRPGKVKPELYNADQLHLVTAGYQVWADSMQPLFDAMAEK